MLNNFEELEIWQESRKVAQRVRHFTRRKDFAKDYKFISQINSAAGSVMDNIAEGFERDGNKEFIQFLSIAKGSNAELRSQIYRALDADFITKDEFNEIQKYTDSIKNKIQKLIEHLKKSDFNGLKYK